MFSVLGVFSVLCFAVVAGVGLDFELSVFPCFGGFGVFFFAVWTLSHNYPVLCFVWECLKHFVDLFVCERLFWSFLLIVHLFHSDLKLKYVRIFRKA